MKTTQVSHDPFSRTCTIRRQVGKRIPAPECAECCRPARFEYGEQSDGPGAHITWDGKLFCSIGCRRTHG